MTPDDAAAILGIETSANLHEVRHAFRELAKATHPDAASGAGANQSDAGALGDLVAARDVLLARHEARATGVPTGPSHSPPAQPARSGSTPQPTQSSRGPAIALSIAGAILGLVVFALVAIVVLALATGGTEQVPSADECVVVGDDSLATTACTTTGAQRIDTRFEGFGQCGVGTNTLIVGDLTYCLRPADQ